MPPNDEKPRHGQSREQYRADELKERLSDYVGKPDFLRDMLKRSADISTEHAADVETFKKYFGVDQPPQSEKEIAQGTGATRTSIREAMRRVQSRLRHYAQRTNEE